MTEKNILLKTIDIKVLMKAAQYNFLKYTNKTTLSEVINSSGASIESILLSCQFNREVCTADDFEAYQLNELYKCFKFNSGRFYNGSRSPIKRNFRNGKEYGLQFKIYTNSQDKCNSPWNTNNGNISIFKYIHGLRPFYPQLCVNNIFQKYVKKDNSFYRYLTIIYKMNSVFNRYL